MECNKLDTDVSDFKRFSKNTDLRVDAHEWMRQLRFEYYRVAQLRRLRIGEQLWIGRINGITQDHCGICECFFMREPRGLWSFLATWTVYYGHRHPHVFTDGRFKLLPGNIIQFQTERDLVAEASFRLVARYCDFLFRHRRRLGIEDGLRSQMGHYPMYRGEVIGKDGQNNIGFKSPPVKGLEAIIDVAIALSVIKDEE